VTDEGLPPGYTMQREHVRGEPTFWSIHKWDEAAVVKMGDCVAEGYSRREVMADFRRYLAAHDPQNARSVNEEAKE
jgi:hypothetical protein